MWTKVLFFGGGVAVGLLVAKFYAQQTITSDVHSALDKVGLGGGTVEKIVDKLVVPT